MNDVSTRLLANQAIKFYDTKVIRAEWQDGRRIVHGQTVSITLPRAEAGPPPWEVNCATGS